MAELDTLNIQISASTSKADNAIDNLIKHLSKLNSALNNYSDSSEYVRSLNNLSGGLDKVADAVSLIDEVKIKNIASALSSLAGAGAKLSAMNVAKSLTQMAQNTESASSRITKAAREMAKEFDITDNAAISELSEEINRLYQSAGDPQAARTAEQNIRDIIGSYRDFGIVVDETYEKVREFVSNTTLFLSQMDVKEFGDDFKTLRGYLGIGNTTTDPSRGIGLDTFLVELQERFPGVISEAQTTQEVFRQLASYFERGAADAERYAQQMREDETHINGVNAALDRLCHNLGIARAKQEEMSAPDMLGVGALDIDDADLPFVEEYGAAVESTARSANTATQALGQLAQKVEEVRDEVVQDVGNPFEGIVNGITSLQGVTITSEQFSGIKTIAESLGKLGGSYAASATQTLPYIAEGLERLSAVTVPDIGNQLISLGEGISKLGSIAATRAQGLPFVAEGLRQLQGIGNIPQIEGLDSLAESLAMFGRKTAQNAVSTIPQLAEAFRSLIETLSSAPNVSQNTIDLAHGIAAIAASGGKAASSMNTLSGRMNSYSRSASRASKHTRSLAAMFGKLYASYFLIIRGFRLLGKAIDVSSGLTEVQNVVDTVFGNASNKIEEFSQTAMKDFGMTELSAKQFASRFQAMGTAMGITSKQVADANEFIAEKVSGSKYAYEDLGSSMADMSVNLTKLTADMASFYNMDYVDVAEDMQAVLTGMTRPLRKYGLDLTEATLKEWAMKNGLDADIDSMSQAQKTMLRYQYVMAQTGHVMGDFEKTADTWANVTRTIGQQFQKMGQIIGEGLINTFRPYLLRFRDFMNDLIALTEKGLNAIGHLMGWEIQLDRVGMTLNEEMEEYADNLDDAAGNAKKLNAQLRGIDELNNLTTNKGGKGGSGAGAGAGLNGLDDISYDDTPRFKKYESSIDSWFNLGKSISDKIKEGLDSIRWNKVYQKAENFGRNFADYLNGRISPEMFYSVGRSIAGALNTAVRFVFQLGQGLDFENVGDALASQVNGFFDNFDFVRLAKSINTWVQGIATSIGTFFKKVDWGTVFKGLFDFISNIDVKTMALVIGALTIKKVASWHIAAKVFSSFTRTLTNGILQRLSMETFSLSKIGEKLAQACLGNFASVAGGLMVGGIVAGIGLMLKAILDNEERIREAQRQMFDQKEIEEYGATVEELVMQMEEYSHELEESRKQRRESIGNNEDITYLEKLSGRYQELSQKVGLTADETNELKLISGKLVEAIPELHNYYDEATGMINLQSDAIERLIKDKENEIKANAYAEAYTEALKEQAEAELKYKEAADKANEARSELIKKQNEIADLQNQAKEDINVKVDWKLLQEEQNLKDNYDSLTKAAEGYRQAVGEVSKDVEYYRDKWSEVQTNIENSTNALNEGVKAAEDAPKKLVEAGNSMAEAISTTFSEEEGESIGETFGNALITSVDGALSSDNILPTVEETNGEIVKNYEEMGASVEGTFTRLQKAVNESVEKIKNAMNFEWSIPAPKVPTFKIEGEFDFEAKKVPKITVDYFANGGYPQKGSLFLAGESGTELMGTIGGKTAVASNGEITGISDTIRQTSATEIELLRQQNQLLQGILQKEFGITKDEVFRSVRSSARDYEYRTGSPAFG